MLHTNSTSATLFLNVAEILLPANWEKETGGDAFGNVFNFKNFATDWESIYWSPSDSDYRYIKNQKGMRKLTSPTLLITSKQDKMVYVLATTDKPVYITTEYEKHPDFGYLMAFGLSPYSSPEYMFYCCKYGIWKDLLERRINKYDEVHNWNNVGAIGYDAKLGEIRFTPEDIVRNLGKVSIPTIIEQEQLVRNAQKHDNKIHLISSQTFEVNDLMRCYTREASLFHHASNMGLLTELYRLAAGKQANLEVLHLLSQYEFQPNILNETEMTFLTENLDKVIDQVLLSNDMAKQRAEGFIQPQELTDLMCYLVSFPEDVTVYNPFAGANSYGLKLHNPIVGDEINPINWAIGQIRLLANEAEKRVDITLRDSFIELGSDKKYPAIMASPAYLYAEGQEINDIISRLYAKLEEGGTMACVVTTRFLYTKNKVATQIRELLIHDHAIKSVIMLPSNIFTGTSIPQAILILSKDGKNSEIKFGDATKHTRFAKNAYRTTTLDFKSFIEAFENDIDVLDSDEVDDEDTGCEIPYSELIGSDLRPSIYLAHKPQAGISLSELATTLPESIGVDIKPTHYITNTSIPEALHYKSFMPAKTVNPQISNDLSYVVIEDNAVILTMVNGKLRTVYTDEFVGRIAFPTGTMKVLHPWNRDNAKYLAALLVSDLVPEQIQAQLNGAVIPNFSQLDLSKVTVRDVVTSKERERIIEDVISSEVDDMKNEKDLKLERLKIELRTTRHAMAQNLSALRINWSEFEYFMHSNDKEVKLSDMIGERNPISVQNMMACIKSSIRKIGCQIDFLKLEYMNWGEPEYIDPYILINQYITDNTHIRFKMVNVGNKNCTLYYDEESDSPNMGKRFVSKLFRAPVQKIHRIFDNIIANADAHGFTDSNRKDYCILFDWESNDEGIVITIANNGTPLLDGVTSEKVLSRGFTKTSNHSGNHTGLGGFEIKELMEGIGTVKIKSQLDNEFTVVYQLTFTDITIENINIF